MEHEVVIVGGGLVGCSLACALAAAGREVALVEASAPAAGAAPGFDERNLALSATSLNALRALGVLAKLSTPPAPIRRIHVSRAGDFGAVRLVAADYGRDAFGAVVIARELGAALEARLGELPGLTRLRPARFEALEPAAHEVRVRLDAGASTAKLIVAADGTDSAVRRALGIEADLHDYAQTLLVCALAADRPHLDQAWERFTDAGPVALLPRADGRYGAVCGVPADATQACLALDEADWLAYLQQRFGGRAGRFLRAGRRSAYPLKSVVAQTLIAPRAVLLGNAAQTLHPVGAQGFNLGLRDALALADLLEAAADPGAQALLADYPARREGDRRRTLAFSDGLARLTATPGTLAHLVRSAGLLALEHVPALRAPLVAGAMGFRGLLPTLARGAG